MKRISNSALLLEKSRLGPATGLDGGPRIPRFATVNALSTFALLENLRINAAHTHDRFTTKRDFYSRVGLRKIGLTRQRRRVSTS
jgi:hypothetical protein